MNQQKAQMCHGFVFSKEQRYLSDLCFNGAGLYTLLQFMTVDLAVKLLNIISLLQYRFRAVDTGEAQLAEESDDEGCLTDPFSIGDQNFPSD